MSPAFLLGAGGWDLHCQSLAVRFFSTQFWQGEPYPRWLPEMFAGDGSPIFFYYPPLAYFITAFFHILGSLDAFDYYPIAASAFLATFVSGVAFYVWVKEETKDANAALIGSLLYVAAPSNLAQNFYYLMLFSSVWAYAFVPLLMYFAKRMALDLPYAVVGFAVTLGLLILTNAPMTLIFGPVAVAYSILYFRKATLMRQAGKLAHAVLLGFGLAAIYLVPSQLYISYASIDLEWTRARLVGEPYLSALKGLHGWICEFYWASALLLSFVYFRMSPKTKERHFFYTISLATLFMMQPISKFLWELFPILYVLQMSERFFAVLSLFLAMSAAITFTRTRILAWGLLGLYACITVVMAVSTRESVESFEKSDPKRYYGYTLNVDQYALFLPNLPGHSLMQRYGTPEGLKEVLENREKITVTSGDAKTEVTKWRPREILFHYKATSPSTLQVRQFDFPGWRAFLDGNDLQVRLGETTGQIVFDVPPGEGEIQLKLTALLPEVAGKLISMVSGLVLLLMVLQEIRQRSKD